jgi:hypothetical protein
MRHVACVGVLALLAFDDSQAGEPKTYKTPQAAFEAAKAAAEQGNVKAVVATFSDESVDAFAGLMIVLGAGARQAGAVLDKTVEDKARTKTIADALERHGVTPELIQAVEAWTKDLKNENPAEGLRALRKLLAPMKDRVTFVADMLGLLNQGKATRPFEELKTAQLRDVTVEGSTAKGMLTLKKEGKDRTEPLEFRSEGGGWKIHIDMKKKKPAPKGTLQGRLPLPRLDRQAEQAAWTWRQVEVGRRACLGASS